MEWPLESGAIRSPSCPYILLELPVQQLLGRHDLGPGTTMLRCRVQERFVSYNDERDVQPPGNRLRRLKCLCKKDQQKFLIPSILRNDARTSVTFELATVENVAVQRDGSIGAKGVKVNLQLMFARLSSA